MSGVCSAVHPLCSGQHPVARMLPGYLRVLNLTRGVSLGDAIAIAADSRSRRKGLLEKQLLLPGEGLWISPCEAVHTFGMHFPIDIVFLDKKKEVVKLYNAVPKRRLAFCLTAHSVLELPAEVIRTTGTLRGDKLDLQRQ